MSDNSHLVESFIGVTNASKYLAQQYLDRNDNDLTGAIEDFYNTNGETGEPSNAGSRSQTPVPRGRATKSGGITTLKDLGDEAESPDDKTQANFFTGGEKSALQVENPDKKKDKRAQPSLVDRIFQRATEQMGEEDDRPSAQGPDAPAEKFTGTGFRLGDSSSTSEVVFDRNANVRARPAKVTREITFWRQGFTVGDGPLRRYDDPENVQTLSELKQGRVPVSLLDVEFGQDVDVNVVRKVDEDYAPPKRKIGGFHGQGQRLGSPVPGEDIYGVHAPVPEASKETPQTTPLSKAATGPGPSDQGEGDSLVQIRFANGKRVSHKFNGSDSVSVVYAFVRGHEHNSSEKPFILSHTFPVKPIEESADTTVASAKLKNAVIVQRWK
ncbi:hypothetical protein JCM33374_g4343 [Metschnikowia sp. JCM 33374]|nr:hypothetical protein JCM33374_g4343 [Metschnikowia sp. JCM 33374]